MHFCIESLAWHAADMNSARIHIRAATEHDKPAVLQLAEGLAAWRNRQAAVLAARRWLTDSFATAARQGGTVLVAVDKTGIAGVISISEQRHFTGEIDGYIGELAVASHAVRHGIGRHSSRWLKPGRKTADYGISLCILEWPISRPAISMRPWASMKKTSG